jgi:anti-anti-sigma regulatory factor
MPHQSCLDACLTKSDGTPCQGASDLMRCEHPGCGGFVTEFHGRNSVIHAVEHFSFICHYGFNAAGEAALRHPGSSRIDIDLSQTKYIDSAVVGLLLVLQQRAEQAGKKIRLTGMSGTVKMVLEMTRLKQRFE